MLRRLFSYGTVAVGSAILTSGIVAAQANDQIIAYVYDYQGSSDAYHVLRPSGTSAPYANEPLGRKDEVKADMVRKPPGPISITLNINGKLQVFGPGGDACVGNEDAKCDARPLSASGGLNDIFKAITRELVALAPQFKNASEDYDSMLAHPLASRGPAVPPTLPILATTPMAATRAGATSLVIPVSGGTPPFQARLFAGNGAQPIAEAQVDSGDEMRFKVASLEKGTYRVTVMDANKATVTESFSAVDPDSVPSPTPALQLAMKADQAFLRDNGEVAYAAYLREQGFQWDLAAYQELQNASPDYSARNQMKSFLAEGQ
jgi:hypothetical protein